ncbi:MAG: hypothetical protein IPO72_09145 [Saprospiraceae bacterium]|nr:hypothetical protein [Candidatus Vicinibacter affinis]MBK7302353.1 hypothetical protein [Candidatus Vicinibacter affinis]MBK9641428.1 hypothetical protein [Candidatus Vicinibacter affinis]
MTSCKKEESTSDLLNTMAVENKYPAIISGNGILDEDPNLVPTILGQVRVNPYTVENMTQAWNSIYANNQVQSLTPTHLYVKFSPVNVEEAKLLEKTGEMFYDFPLENEMIQMGDYYPQPGKEFPEVWAVVCPGFQSPISGYQIIAQLVIPPYESILTKTAFELTGNAWSNPEDPMGSPDPSGCAPGSPDYPDCLNAINKRYGNIPSGDGDPCYQVIGGDGNTTLNGCGCMVYNDARKPGGCVKVKDVEKSRFEGVRRVKIIMKDTWFTEDETWTDDLGCWKIDERYHGNAWMWIKFANSRGQIRGARSGFASVYDWIWPVKDYLGKIRTGPPYNNIEVKYDLWSSRGSAAHIHWGAATANNALHEHHDYSAAEGINSPPWIDIFVGRNHKYGYTIMNSYLGNSNVIKNLASGSIFGLPFLGAPGGLGALFPDVYLGIDYQNSDYQKRLAYHEYAHSSHFTKAGPLFWEELISAEAGANGHGNSGSKNAGIISISESWAEHIGLSYTHKTYAGFPNNSYYGNDWNQSEEKTRNEESNHIPIGLYNDFMDGLDEEWANNYYSGGSGTILDWVKGFTNSQMFNLLGVSTTSPTIFKDKFIQVHANGNPFLINQINGLFNSY